MFANFAGEPWVQGAGGPRTWHRALVIAPTANAFGLTVGNGFEQFVTFDPARASA